MQAGSDRTGQDTTKPGPGRVWPFCLPTWRRADDGFGESKSNVAAEAAVNRELGSLHDQTGRDWALPIDPASGEDVLDDAVRVIMKSIGTRLVAAYALGSLAHGGFSPLVSDVDMALILTDPIRSSDNGLLLGVAEEVRSIGSPLHTRLSIFWGTPSSLGG